MKPTPTPAKKPVPQDAGVAKRRRRDAWLVAHPEQVNQERIKIQLDVEPVVLAALTVCTKDEDLRGNATTIRKAVIRYLRHEGYLTAEEP